MIGVRSARNRSAQYAGLRRLLGGLRALAGGEVMGEALERFQTYLNGRVKGELKRHVYTGHALATSRVELAPGELAVAIPRYYKYIRWSFKKGIPLSALKRGQALVREALMRRFGLGR